MMILAIGSKLDESTIHRAALPIFHSPIELVRLLYLIRKQSSVSNFVVSFIPVLDQRVQQVYNASGSYHLPIAAKRWNWKSCKRM